MNLLKALFSTPITEADLCEQSDVEMHTFPDVEPLWQDFDKNQAVVTETISPNMLGRVKFQGTWWRAGSDLAFTLEAGTTVQVIGRHRCSILIVEPIHSVEPIHAEAFT
ncbi:MAG: NfeD family protein [Cyanobacteria bacterium P01_F01_bin.86]